MKKNHLELFKQFLDAKISYRNIHIIYQMISFCGRGTYGYVNIFVIYLLQVFKYKNRLNGEYVACKSLKISQINQYEVYIR